MYEQRQAQNVYNDDPREQGYKIRPRSTRRGWRTLPLILLLVLAIAGSIVLWIFLSPLQQASLPQRTFSIAGHSHLIVNNGAGHLHVHAGKGNSIVVQGTKSIKGLAVSVDDIKVKYEQQGDTITINAEEDGPFIGLKYVDLDIIVPSSLDTKLNTGSGTIDIEGVSGRIEATAGSGSINLTQVSGNEDLETGSGGIHLKNVRGAMKVQTGSGGIDAEQVQLGGRSKLTTGSGGIQFQGSLDPQGRYRMETGSGGIALILPPNASFHLDAHTGSGGITNDFSNTEVGSAPQPALSLKTGSGSITINKNR